MGYDRGDSFPFDFEPNGIQFGSIFDFIFNNLIYQFNFIFNIWFNIYILNQMEFNLVQYRKGNCHHDHIPFNVKGNGNIVFSV